ncbi:hypothetical protein [Flavisphingomonas formosensis]|uniref:hypothetical protein n=1 Tax=Flavisphingomonas formosensis TaxID=861534 RepID=UPI0012FAD6B6|nr:hypothetical protein [Sphingomonas formosensis]
MHKSLVLAGGAALLLLLAGCHKKADLDNAGATADNATTASGNATAEEVAAEARGDVSCPATAETPRPAGAPVDDVVGVRPGMGWGEAAHFVMCDNPLLVVKETADRNYDIDTHGTKIRQGFLASFAEPRVEKTGQDIVKEMQEDSMRRGMNAYEAPLKPGQSRYFVSTMGLPGQEKVVSVAREEYYEAGKLPTVESVEAALKAKYGSPSLARDGNKVRQIFWEYDPSGRPVTETSPLYERCMITASPDASTQLNPDCGVTVGAQITQSDDNPGLAHSLAVTAQNGAEGVKRINDTEQALSQADQQRQANEVKGAAQSADKPKL